MAGTSNHMHLWDVITCACPGYLILPHTSPHMTVSFPELSSYPDYFREPNHFPMQLPEISRLTLTGVRSITFQMFLYREATILWYLCLMSMDSVHCINTTCTDPFLPSHFQVIGYMDIRHISSDLLQKCVNITVRDLAVEFNMWNKITARLFYDYEYIFFTIHCSSKRPKIFCQTWPNREFRIFAHTCI